MINRFVSLLLTLGLAACSSVNEQFTTFMGGEENIAPPTPLVEFTPKTEINKVWVKNVGGGTDDKYLKLVPVWNKDRIFVADNDGDIIALDISNGKILWDKDTDTNITGGPGSGDSYVVVGSGEGEVITMSLETGEILWEKKVSSEILSAPQVTHDIVVVRTIDGKIFGLDINEGNRLWVYERTVPALTLRGTSSPVIADYFVIAGFDAGLLVAIDINTGKQVWETRIAIGSGRTELERMIDIDAEPIVVGTTIYVATFQGRIAAVNLMTGSLEWARDIASYAGLCVDDSNLYVTDDDSYIWALDRFTGTSIWKQESLQARAVTAPAVFGDFVVVADLEGYLHWLDKRTGEFVARIQLSESQIIAAPMTINNLVIAYASDGTLGAYTYDNFSDTTTIEPLLSESREEMEEPEPEVEVDQTDTEYDSLVDKSVPVENTQENNTQDEEKRGSFFSRIWDAMTGKEDEEIVP